MKWTASKVRMLRERMGLSQELFAKALDPSKKLSAFTVSRWERGISRVSPWYAGALDVLERKSVRKR